MSEVSVPGWVQDAVFYQIFPDRFARSERVPKPGHLEPWSSPPTPVGFKGGDLLGVVERLDYLSDLGINALYLNPIFQSAANHRYHTHDYFRVDPLLGGDAAFRTLLDRAHSRGIRVVLDGVFNHASRGFFQFNHILENGPHSPYVDWFNVFEYPLNAYDHSRDPAYAAWWNLHALPKFNTDLPAVRDFLIAAATHWIRFGIDGWRLDVPNEIEDDSFWQRFRREVKEINEDAYICGEIWGDASHWLQGDQFDSVMNYLFTRAVLGFFIGDQIDDESVRDVGYYPIPILDAPRMAAAIEHLLALYPDPVTRVQLNLLSSHDTARFLTIARGERAALKMATLFQMTYPGAPCIYYGDEIGMAGGRDPGSRAGFPWASPDQWDHDLLDFFRDSTQLRHTHPALRRGTFRTLHAEGTVFIFERRTDDEQVIVAFNTGREPAHVSLDLPPGHLNPLLDAPRVPSVPSGPTPLALPPRQGAVWELNP